MKRIFVSIGVVFVSMLVLLAANDTLAAGKNKGKKSVAKKVAPIVTLQGEVSKQVNAKGKLLGVQFRSDVGKSYRVALNRNGVKLGKDLHGKKAEVVANLFVRGTKKRPVEWLQVKKFKEIEEPPAQEEEEETTPEDDYGYDDDIP